MLLLWYRLRKKRLQKEKRRKYWGRPIFKKRKLFGEFHQMLNELWVKDREYFFRYMWMSPEENFDHLLLLVQDKIYKKNTRFHESIPAAERLAVTLRFLATWDPQQSLYSYSFRIEKSTLSRIISETCTAIFESLKYQYTSCHLENGLNIYWLWVTLGFTTCNRCNRWKANSHQMSKKICHFVSQL